MNAPAACTPRTTPTVRRRAIGWALLPHAFPVVAVTSATALIAALSGGEDAGPGRVVLLTVTMFFGQLSIGIQNEYLDRGRDAQVKPWKPIPAGLVPARAAAVAGFLVAIVFLVLVAIPGGVAWLLGTAAVASGWVYNVWLKHSRLGALAYLSGFSLLPVWAWYVTDALRPELLYVYAFGLPLILGVHLANHIPDLAADRITGVRNLAALLGPVAATRVAWLSALVGLLAWVVGILASGRAGPAAAGVLALAVVLLGAGFLATFRAGRHWVAFRLLAMATLMLAAGWLVLAR